MSLEQSQDAAVPELKLHAEVRASLKVEVRGGILAESPGYGKTILSLGVIHSQFQTQTHSEIVNDLQSRQKSNTTSRDLIPVAATVDICPPTLVGQWTAEAEDKAGYRSEVICISAMRDLDKFTIDDIKAARIVMVSRNLLNSPGYIARQAVFAALPGPASLKGLIFADWLHVALQRVPEHVRILEDEGLQKLRQHVQDRFARDMASDRFSGMLPSRRTRGKNYVPTGKAKNVLELDKPAPKYLDISSLGKPLLEMFFFNRLIVDEFHQMDQVQQASVYSLRADRRWGLSATPAIADLWDTAHLGRLLGVDLPVGSPQKGMMKVKNARSYHKEMTAFEKFHACLFTVSNAAHARQRKNRQDFLNTFVSRNVEEFKEIRCEDNIVPVPLDPVHQTVYTELSMYLNSRGMRTSKGSNSKTTDRETRLYSALEDSDTAEEALSKTAAFISHAELGSDKEGLDALMRVRQQELADSLARLKRSIQLAKSTEPKVFAAWRRVRVVEEGGIDDQEIASQVEKMCELPAVKPSSKKDHSDEEDAPKV